MLTILLVVLAILAVMGLVGGVAHMLGSDGFIGFWFGMEIVKGSAQLLGVVFAALADAMSQNS